jgi:microcystin-dependent protein
MTNPYTTVAVSGYNTSPPSDDGVAESQNQVSWSKHKEKLSDPLKTALETINTNIIAAFGKRAYNSTATITGGQVLTGTQEGQLLLASNEITLTLPLASAVGDGTMIAIRNVGTKLVTIQRQGSETIDGGTSIALFPRATIAIVSTAALWWSHGDLAPGGFRPGDFKDTLRSTADPGFLLPYGQTLGSAASGADVAGAQYELLFEIVKNAEPNAGTESFAGNDTVIMPDLRGRAKFGLDNMGGTSADRLTAGSKAGVDGDTVGAAGGVEEHATTIAETAAHTHGDVSRTGGGTTIGGSGALGVQQVTGTTSQTGGGEPHTNLPPGIVVPVQIAY